MFWGEEVLHQLVFTKVQSDKFSQYNKITTVLCSSTQEGRNTDTVDFEMKAAYGQVEGGVHA